MDDRSFDNIIRQKANSYQDQGVDAHALTDMRNRMQGLSSNAATGTTGWSKNLTLAVGLLLFTLLNLGVVWYFSEGRNAQLQLELEQLEHERTQLVQSLQPRVSLQKMAQ